MRAETYMVCRTTLCGVRGRLWRLIEQQSDKYRGKLELLFSVVSCYGDRERDDTAERQCAVGQVTGETEHPLQLRRH